MTPQANRGIWQAIHAHALLAAFLVFLIVAPHPVKAEMQDFPVVRLQSLDKITARTKTFNTEVGSTIKYGPLYIKVQACRKAPPIEEPESAAFLQIWEITPDDVAKWVFSGWMFASSPALSYMDHPIYDVWVLDCLETPDVKPKQESTSSGVPVDSEQAAEQTLEETVEGSANLETDSGEESVYEENTEISE